MALAGLALVLVAGGCESTESESARLGREGAKLIASAGTVGLGAANQAVRVGQVALVQGAGRTAAAVQLTDTGALPQSDVPVLIDVRDAHGRSLYRNDIQGLEPSLQAMPLLPAHQSSWWVDDQVLAAGTPRSVLVRVGAARGGAARSPAAVQVSVAEVGNSVAGPYLEGDAVNRSGVAQHNLPVFAVALRGARVVAAGRALVPSLPPGAHPTSFRIYLVGSPAGAHIELTVAPQE